MSYVQLHQGLIRNNKKFKLNLPRNYAASEYVKRFPYLSNAKDPKFQNDAIDIVNKRADLRKLSLATSDYGKNIQEGINSVVNDGRFNNVAIRHLLDNKNKVVFKSPTPFSVTFKDANKLDIQNPVIGNLLSQGNANQLTDQLVKNILGEGENLKIRARLEALRNNTFTGGDDDDDEDGSDGGSDGGGGYRRKFKKKNRGDDNHRLLQNYLHYYQLP